MSNNTKTNHPTIRIKYGWLLRYQASEHLHELWGEGRKMMSDEWYRNRAKEYADAWRPFEKKILKGMTEITGLQFRQKYIDVYVAPWFRAFSDPLVIGVTEKPDEFVDTLTHELLHRLLTDNTTVPYDKRLIPEWKKMFGDAHTQKTLVHIPVHAVHKAIYFDVLKDDTRLKRELKHLKKWKAEDYLRAWDYVDENDHKKIIEKLKKNYSKLGKKK